MHTFETIFYGSTLQYYKIYCTDDDQNVLYDNLVILILNINRSESDNFIIGLF